MSDLTKHQILNCGDMKKDGKEDPNIASLPIFQNAVDYITGIKCTNQETQFSELKRLINDELLDNVKKYSFATLLPIPEDEPSDSADQNVIFINKNNRKVVPDNVINAFIDAAMDPSKYFMAPTITICETPASNIDPGSRKDNNSFYPNTNKDYPLNSYGFKKTSVFKYKKDLDEDDYKYIEIILDPDNFFKGSVNRKGNIKDTYTVSLAGREYKNADVAFTDIFEKFFQGNTEKNTYISKNKDTKQAEIKMLCTLLIFFKELGDTTQPIIISNLFENDSDNPIQKNNACLLTIDTVLACRCALINVPYLLNSNSIITYYPAIDDVTYEKNMKLNEIKKVIENNNEIKAQYSAIYTDIQFKTMYLIEGTTYNITPQLKDRFKNIIDCIENVIKFLNLLKEQLESSSEVITKENNIITDKSSEIIKQDFDKFRSIIQSLQTQTIYIYKGKSKVKKIIPGKYSLFPLKLIIKEEYFTLKDYIDNILFKDGIINYFIRENTNFRVGQRGGTNDGDHDEYKLYYYLLLYPYIYCNPYLLPYILNKNGDDLITYLNIILTNILKPDYDDEKKPINNFVVPLPLLSDDQINNVYFKELLYYLQDDNALPNMDAEIDNYEIYTNKLLEKLDFFVRNTQEKSLFIVHSISQEQASQEALLPKTQQLDPPIVLSQETQELEPLEALSQQEDMLEERQLLRVQPTLHKYPSQSSEILTPRLEKRKTLDETNEIEKNLTKSLKKSQTASSSIMEGVGGKKTKNKNKKEKKKKTKKKYKNKSKILYKKKNIKKRITKTNKISKKGKKTKNKK